MKNKKKVETLESKLDSFNKNIRISTLKKLKKCLENQEYSVLPSRRWINLHAHSFFSFNAYGYSPSHIVWKAFKEGLDMVGIVDFDVLDALNETYTAGEILGMRVTSGIETRVFFNELKDKVINSPNEPGIFYIVGIGFYKMPDSNKNEYKVFKSLREIAERRNIEILKKINTFLEKFKVDYEKDVLILTPSGNATERHLLTAINEKSKKYFAERKNYIDFWSEKLRLDKKTVEKYSENDSEFNEILRTKLIKYGSVGYVRPEKDKFPSIDDVSIMISKSDGLVTSAWLDGTNEGERNPEELLGLLLKKGMVMMTLMPERNLDIVNPEEKKIKLKKFKEIMMIAKDFGLPVVPGTEMNKFGQKFVNDFSKGELAGYLDYFYRSSMFVYAHCILGKYCNKGFESKWANRHFKDRKGKTDFYIEAGFILRPDINYEYLKNYSNEQISPSELVKGLKKLVNNYVKNLRENI